jgi:YCII-related domain
MKFLMMIKHAEPATSFQPPKSLMNAMEVFMGEGFKDGWLKETAGPFTEAKEIVGGFAIVETKTRDEALEIARRFMELHRIHIPDFECESEVRPFDDM